MFSKVLCARLNAPVTSSAGRLFDAFAALLDLCQVNRHEGQAAMALEFACDETDAGRAYSCELRLAQPTGSSAGPGGSGPDSPTASAVWILDWVPMIRGVLADLGGGVGPGKIAMRIHRGLAGSIVAVAERVRLPRVLLTGGCFQNRLLLELAVDRLQKAGFQPYWHQRIPPNDGGIAAGQAIGALRMLRARGPYVSGDSR